MKISVNDLIVSKNTNYLKRLSNANISWAIQAERKERVVLGFLNFARGIYSPKK